jgi:prophage antirepressor-like protein
MTRKQAIKLFGEKKVRTIWDDEKEQWYFCVVDVVEVLTESKDPSGYIKTMKRRDPMLAKGWGQIVTPLFVQTPGGRQKMNFSTMKGIFRINVVVGTGTWGIAAVIPRICPCGY